MSLHYIIDGYNLINHRNFNPPKKYTDVRFALINIIKKEQLCKSSKNSITLVFDGHGNFNSAIDIGANQGIDVIFSCDQKADDKIKSLVEHSKQPKNIVVVSDDREIVEFVSIHGAKVVDVATFFEGYKNKFVSHKGKYFDASKINDAQMDMINDEFKKIWLKEK